MKTVPPIEIPTALNGVRKGEGSPAEPFIYVVPPPVPTGRQDELETLNAPYISIGVKQRRRPDANGWVEAIRDLSSFDPLSIFNENVRSQHKSTQRSAYR